MSTSAHIARIRRLLLARAERVAGGDLTTAAPLVFTVGGDTFEARVDGRGDLRVKVIVEGAPHDSGLEVRTRADEVTDVLLDRLLEQQARRADFARRAAAQRDGDLRDAASQRRPVSLPEATPPPPTPTPAPEGGRDSVLARLEALIGLAPVKQLIAGLAHLHDFDRQRVRRGLPAVAPSPHLVFTGNPGTGKTTVARLVGELYKAVGVLPTGHVVEATRADLVAAYLGQTALKTRALCEQALGGVLFIDEAYTLTRGHFDEYGEEAIAELLTFMENHRGQFAVIVAGYPDEMQQFLASNPGLRSRFDAVVAFPDYGDDELLRIFDVLVAENRFTLTPAARAAVAAAIAALPRDRSFANARSVRNLFNNVVANHARGLAQGTLRTDAMNMIEDRAVPRASDDAPPTGTDTDTDGGERGHPGYL